MKVGVGYNCILILCNIAAVTVLIIQLVSRRVVCVFMLIGMEGREEERKEGRIQSAVASLPPI